MTLKEDIQHTAKQICNKVIWLWENKIWGKKRIPAKYTGFKPTIIEEPTCIRPRQYRFTNKIVDRLIHKIINDEIKYRDTGFDLLRVGKDEEISIFTYHVSKRINITILDESVILTDSDSREAYEALAENKVLKYFKDKEEKKRKKDKVIDDILY